MNDKSQHWLFEKEGNSWRIMNRSSSCCHNCSKLHGGGPTCYIGIFEDAPVAKLDEEGEDHQRWTIKADHHSPPGVFRIHPFKSTYHLSLEANTVKIVTEENTHLPVADTEKWKITEVWPSPSAGNYRVRGLSGLVLSVDSDHVKASQYVNSEPEWEIIPGNNSNCMIKNVKTNQYISGRSSGYDDSKDHTIETTFGEFEWTLVRIGSIAYSIVINRKNVGDPLSVYNGANQQDVLAITMGAEQEISLAEYKGAHGQIWIFEKEDLPRDSTDESSSEDEFE